MEGNRSWVEINLDSLKGNFRAIREKVGNRGILVPVKADGYGHGGIQVSKVLALEGAQMLGVASSGEGSELRSAPIRLPILILSPSTREEIPCILKNNLTPSVVDRDFATQLSQEAQKMGRVVKVHVEVETGMGRTGVDLVNAPGFITSLLKMKNLEVEGVYTHFACAGESEKSFTQKQLMRFQGVVKSLKERGIEIPFTHTANSAALLNFPEAYYNMVRPGLLVYGHYPSLDSVRSISVKPILSFKTRVVQMKEARKGDTIGYGRTFRVERKSLIAVLSVGYGDGFLRSLSNRGEVLLRGKRAKVVGTVSMDLITVDVTGIPGVRVGDAAVLIGREGKEEITAHEVAKWAGTIPYEILSSIGIRVRRIYLEKEKEIRIPLYSGEKGRFPASPAKRGEQKPEEVSLMN